MKKIFRKIGNGVRNVLSLIDRGIHYAYHRLPRPVAKGVNLLYTGMCYVVAIPLVCVLCVLCVVFMVFICLISSYDFLIKKIFRKNSNAWSFLDIIDRYRDFVVHCLPHRVVEAVRMLFLGVCYAVGIPGGCVLAVLAVLAMLVGGVVYSIVYIIIHVIKMLRRRIKYRNDPETLAKLEHEEYLRQRKEWEMEENRPDMGGCIGPSLGHDW